MPIQDQPGGKVTGGQVSVGRAQPSTAIAGRLDGEVHRRAKASLRKQILTALTGNPLARNGGPGLVDKAIKAIERILTSEALEKADPKLVLDAVDRVIRLLPFILEKEGEAQASAIGQALKGGANVQIVFGSYFANRSSSDQPGQAQTSQPGAGQVLTVLPGQAGPGFPPPPGPGEPPGLGAGGGGGAIPPPKTWPSDEQKG